jgi:hypothetical protein
MRNIILLLLIFIFSACSTESGAYKKSNTITNHLSKNIPHPWSEISSEGSDYALRNNKTKSIFLFNSSCRKYEGSSLNALTNSILTGIEDLIIIENKNVFYQEREAVEVVASGKLDGILRHFKIVTIQKNSCIYDYVLISTNKKNLETDSIDLKTFLERITLN